MPRRLNIAIIGAGLSGLGAALMLRKKHDITIFESSNYIGGQNNSIKLDIGEKPVYIDTGFYAFNKKNSPNITRIFDKYSVPYEKTELSYSFALADGSYEFSNQGTLPGLANLFNPMHLHMLWQKRRFNKNSGKVLGQEGDIKVADMLANMKMGRRFVNRYFLPFTAGIWNSAPDTILEFDAKNCVEFLDNQGAKSNFKNSSFYICSGGCIEFIKLASHRLKDHIRLNTKIDVIQRLGQGIMVNKEKFDHVIFATHADTALSILKSPTIAEKQVLSQYRYNTNQIFIHQDESFMPKSRKRWSAINCQSDENGYKTITYYMNKVQNLACKESIFLSVNPVSEPTNILAKLVNKTPIFDINATKSRSYFGEIQNLDRITFCGSWQGDGKMEDAFTSGIAAAGHIISKWG